MGSRGVWASTESLLEDRKGELDKGLSVRKHLPILFKVIFTQEERAAKNREGL